MRVVLYARVSTDAQERDGSSLETQEKACRDYARQSGWSVVDAIRDTASGYSLERPGIELVREMLRLGRTDLVLAYAVDRLSRNQNHIGVLFDEAQQADVRLDFVTEKFEDTAVGRFILAARAFIAEIEREKIVERTTRGKLARARSGRIPQAMGRGTYGYTYNPATGKREIAPEQAEVVRRIFQRYLESRSFSLVSNELNDAGVPSFTDRRWYPLTVRRILLNESYMGRLIFRRTKWVAVRTPSGKRRRRPTPRPVEDHIEIEGASPAIVTNDLWDQVQAILSDPERSVPRFSSRTYALKSRMKCGVCGSAMVGQTMRSKGREYRYYGCRHIYDRRTGHSCTSRFVRADRLEAAVWRELKRVLADPQLVLSELQRANGEGDGPGLATLERQAEALKQRERRLVRLYTFGELDDAAITAESADLRKQRATLESQIEAERGRRTIPAQPLDHQAITGACAAVNTWLDQADEAERLLVLQACQIAVEATRDEANISGVLPVEAPEFFNVQRAWA